MYSTAKTLYKELKQYEKEITNHMEEYEKIEFLQSEEYKIMKSKKYEMLLKEFEEIANIEIDIRERYKKVVEERGYTNQDRLLDNQTTTHNNKGKVLKPYLVTINPKENVIQTHNDLMEFKDKIEKFCNRKMIDKNNLLTYSLEQRKGKDDPELGKGVHSHIICFCDLPKSDLLKNTISTFNKMCEPQGIDIRPINDIEIAKKYISGENKGGKDQETIEKKKLHAQGDIKWREINGLQTTYTYPFEGGDETSPMTSPPIITPSNITLEF